MPLGVARAPRETLRESRILVEDRPWLVELSSGRGAGELRVSRDDPRQALATLAVRRLTHGGEPALGIAAALLDPASARSFAVQHFLWRGLGALTSEQGAARLVLEHEVPRSWELLLRLAGRRADGPGTSPERGALPLLVRQLLTLGAEVSGCRTGQHADTLILELSADLRRAPLALRERYFGPDARPGAAPAPALDGFSARS